MNATPKTKLCWNCEARVSPYEENCPYCCVYLNPLPKPRGLLDDAEKVAPPYKTSRDYEADIPEAPFANRQSKNDEDPGDRTAFEDETTEKKSLGSLLPLTLLLCGSIFLLFSISLFLFSGNGVLTLKWDGQYRYIYLLIAVMLITFGWRALQNVPDVE